MVKIARALVISAAILGGSYLLANRYTVVSDSIDDQPVSEPFLTILQERFLMEEVLEIFEGTTDRNEVRELMTGEKAYQFMGTQHQFGATLDHYNRDTPTEGALGYYTYFRKEDGPLFMIDVVVNSLDETNVQAAVTLEKNALDTRYHTTHNLYFLGIYIPDDQHILKIMLTKTPLSQGFVYMIRYGYGPSPDH